MLVKQPSQEPVELETPPQYRNRRRACIALWTMTEKQSTSRLKMETQWLTMTMKRTSSNRYTGLSSQQLTVR